MSRVYTPCLSFGKALTMLMMFRPGDLIYQSRVTLLQAEDVPRQIQRRMKANQGLGRRLMARWAKMTERGCYTLTKSLKQRLRRVADDTRLSESRHVRNALSLYFDRLDSELGAEKRGRDDV